MKIAVTYENGQVFQHFGHTAQFKIYEVQDGQVASSQVVDTNGSGHGALAGFLKAQGVDTLICGGIGGGARQALAEAIRVTRPGGVIFAAYVISDGCLLDEGFNRGNISVSQYVRDGLLDAKTFAARSEPKDLFELVRREDVDELMSVFDAVRLHYVASDGCALLLREAVDAMDDEAFELYLRYHFATCEREDLLGVTSHALDVFRKRG